jgi:hypothetical protein
VPYSLNRISECSDRSHMARVSDSAFADEAAGVMLTPRSMCNSLISVDSNCTEYENEETEPEEADAAVATGVPVPFGNAARKGAPVFVPTLQLKHLAFKSMPSITEEAFGALPEAFDDAARSSMHASHARSSMISSLPVEPSDLTPRPDDGSSEVHIVDVPMHEASGVITTYRSMCSNPFIDEQERTENNEQEQEIHTHACATVASVPSPRSDMVFGEKILASRPIQDAFEGDRLLTTQHPTPCMSIMHEEGEAVPDCSSMKLAAEAPLTPLVDTITCSGDKGVSHTSVEKDR